jgi:hypothetical protein
MDWVLILSVQWIVSGIAPAPTTLTSVDYQTEELCKEAVRLIKAEMASPIQGTVTRVRAVCVRRK